jgi:hypothetical protein
VRAAGDDEFGSRTGGVHEDAEQGSIGYQLVEQLQLFGRQLGLYNGAAGKVPAGAVEAGDMTHCDRVSSAKKDDGNGRGCCLRRQRCVDAAGQDHGYAAADEIGCERRQTIELVLRIPILHCHVLALDIAGFLQALEKWNGQFLVDLISGLGDEEPDHRQRRLLRLRPNRPRAALPSPAINSRRRICHPSEPLDRQQPTATMYLRTGCVWLRGDLQRGCGSWPIWAATASGRWVRSLGPSSRRRGTRATRGNQYLEVS